MWKAIWGIDCKRTTELEETLAIIYFNSFISKMETEAYLCWMTFPRNICLCQTRTGSQMYFPRVVSPNIKSATVCLRVSLDPVPLRSKSLESGLRRLPFISCMILGDLLTHLLQACFLIHKWDWYSTLAVLWGLNEVRYYTEAYANVVGWLVYLPSVHM